MGKGVVHVGDGRPRGPHGVDGGGDPGYERRSLLGVADGAAPETGKQRLAVGKGDAESRAPVQTRLKVVVLAGGRAELERVHGYACDTDHVGGLELVWMFFFFFYCELRSGSLCKWQFTGLCHLVWERESW